MAIQFPAEVVYVALVVGESQEAKILFNVIPSLQQPRQFTLPVARQQGIVYFYVVIQGVLSAQWIAQHYFNPGLIATSVGYRGHETVCIPC